MKVIAAVPNYNMRENLGALLMALRREKLDGIYVLDDASTDGSADFVAEKFGDVTVVRGQKNVGAGANRNRLLPHLRGDELVLFLDADLELVSHGLRKAVEGWFADAQVGLVGGLILAKAGKPMFWNYGSAVNPMRDARVGVYQEVAKVSAVKTRAVRRVRELALQTGDTYNFEIQYEAPVRRKVDWVAEGLFAVRAEVYKLGGFDARFRYHADQDLGVRVAEAGYGVWFDPLVCARHLELDVRGETRWEEFRDGQFLFYQKHWGLSRQVFEQLFPKV